MSFAEFAALCGGFDDFHAVQSEGGDAAPPSATEYYAALGTQKP